MQPISNQSQAQLVPFASKGVKGMINPQTLDWTKHHGTTKDGAKVNSLATASFGDSTFIAGEDGQVFSATTDEIEVLAKRFLSELGYQISAPKA